MASSVIVQYVPDAVTNERINIGIVALADGRAKALFLTSWHRVKQFAGKDISFLKEIARDSRHWDESSVKRLASQWTGSVQFTPPAFSTMGINETLVDAARRFLFEQAAAERGYRGKADVVRMARNRIREKLIERLGSYARALIRDKDYELKGTHMAYEFDISVGNGQPLFAAQGISFEVPDTRHLEKEVTSTAWLIQDVKKESPDLPIAVAVLPPKHSRPEFGQATDIFRELGAAVLEQNQVSEWADKRIDDLPPDIRARRR